MIKHFSYLILYGILLSWSFPNLSDASYSRPVDTHTHTSTIELKPASVYNSFMLASVCFLGTDNCGNSSFAKADEDMIIDTAQQCLSEGFNISCAVGWHPEIGSECPYNSTYKKCCKETCPTNTATSCTGEDVGDDGCGYVCKKCCVTNCPTEYNFTDTQTNDSSGYIKDGSDYCDHCTKGRLFKRKKAPCDGFTDTCPYGVYDSSDYCLSGSVKKYKTNNCKPCTPNCYLSGESSSYRNCGYYSTPALRSDGCGGYCYNCCDGYLNVFSDGYNAYAATNQCYAKDVQAGAIWVSPGYGNNTPPIFYGHVTTNAFYNNPDYDAIFLGGYSIGSFNCWTGTWGESCY